MTPMPDGVPLSPTFSSSPELLGGGGRSGREGGEGRESEEGGGKVSLIAGAADGGYFSREKRSE